jgi:hypothetical protein
MVRGIRRLGIALGSFVAAWLVVSMVTGVAFGSSTSGSPLALLVAVAVGALIYLDIIRRDRKAPKELDPSAATSQRP